MRLKALIIDSDIKIKSPKLGIEIENSFIISYLRLYYT
jgi:hypothetical protein